MYLTVQHRVRDYDAWKPYFDEHGGVRAAHGCTRERVLRSLDDPAAITIEMQFPSAEHARGFLADPSLKEVMSEAGVIGEPVASLLDEVSERSYAGARG